MSDEAGSSSSDMDYPEVNEAEAELHKGEFLPDTPSSPDIALPSGVDDGDERAVFDPLAALDEYQIDKLRRMREAVDAMDLNERERVWADDMCLLRYLRAREWKLKKSVPMIKETIEWRREFKPWTIRPEEVEPESVTGKNYRFGKDKFGRPIIVMTPARENTDTHERQVRLTVYVIERCIEEMDALHHGVEQIILIIDNNGFTMRNAPPLKVSKQVLHILSNHYPERLGLALVVDAPFYFKMFWAMISPFINKVTSRKIVFASGSCEPGSKKYQTFAKFADMTQLEKRFGGSSDFTYVHEQYWPRETELFYEKHTAAYWEQE